ncbi:MAG: hypothetical protein FJ020_05055 [Chloroflexi bacterium]|nr:hypothetical protein [Chloroflexota bacterium]
MDLGTRGGGAAVGPVRGLARLLAAVLTAALIVAGGLATVEAAGTPPAPPVNLAPSDNATEVSRNPTLQCSAFSDNDTGDTHRASQWQIAATADTYTSPVFDLTTTDNTSLLQVAVPGGKLSDNTTYFWHVRHQDSQEAWSDWSPQTSFSTLNHQPAQPANVAPSDIATEISLNPTLQSSAFSDPDASDSHAATQWRITATADNYTSPAFDTTTTDSAKLTQIAVPGGKLVDNTVYFWQVRHRDNHDTWSEWSAQTSFKPNNRDPDPPAVVSPLGGESVNTTATLKSSAFSDPDANDTQGASRWQITATPGDYSDAALILDDITLKDSERTAVTIFAGVLKPVSTYYWRVKHQDNHGAWSDWSPESSFTTVNRPPDKPAELSPKSGTLGVITTPDLRAKFSDPDGDPDYAASQWQITATAGDYSSPVWDHTSDAPRATVPGGTLSTGTDYYYHVRHQDKQGEWSDWCDEAAFTTWTGLPSVGGGGLPFWAWLLIAMFGAAAVVFAAMVLRSRSQAQAAPRQERRRRG